MRAFDLFLGFITAFVITGGSIITGVLFSGYTVNEKTWLAAIVSGAVMGMKDIRSSAKLPPLSNGNLEALKQLYASQPTPKPLDAEAQGGVDKQA